MYTYDMYLFVSVSIYNSTIDSLCLSITPSSVTYKPGGGFKYLQIFAPTWGRFPI